MKADGAMVGPEHTATQLFDSFCVRLDDGQLASFNGSVLEAMGPARRVGHSLCAADLAGKITALEGIGCRVGESGGWVELTWRFEGPDPSRDTMECAELADGVVTCGKPGKLHQVLTRVTSLAAGYRFICALRKRGDVWCWGVNDPGGLGDGHRYSSERPVRVRLPTGATQITTGAHHACALLVDDRLWCWGDSARGALGIGAPLSGGDVEPAGPFEYLTPQLVPLPNVAQVEASEGTCALTHTGEVFCWGENAMVPEGLPATSSGFPATTPTRIQGLPPVKRLGSPPNCALTDKGELYCWGAALDYPNPDTVARRVPVRLDSR